MQCRRGRRKSWGERGGRGLGKQVIQRRERQDLQPAPVAMGTPKPSPSLSLGESGEATEERRESKGQVRGWLMAFSRMSQATRARLVPRGQR